MRIIALVSLLVLAISMTSCNKKQANMEPVTPAPSQPVEPSPAAPVQNVEPAPTDRTDEISRLLQPVFFDYNRFDIRPDQAATLQGNARLLKEHETVQIILEGHCDERGTEEYNLALGERRAAAARDYLVQLGIDSGRIRTISYGESRPFELGHDENSWRQNRRAHSMAVK